MLTGGLRRFGEFELDPANHVLIGNGEVIKLAPQPFKILVLLIGATGHARDASVASVGRLGR